MKRLLENVLIGVFLVILMVAGYQLYKIWEEYHKAEAEYSTLQEFVKTPEREPDGMEPEKIEPVDLEEQESTIDFEGLKKVNPDIVAWIRIEAAGIDYPVVQGEDNDYYLHHTFRGESNIAGSIFMDYRNVDFMDEKVILYGHNMRDGSMFAGLKDLNVSEKPIAVVYTPAEILKYRLYEENFVSPKDEVYQLKSEPEHHGDSRELDKSSRTLILSTCSNGRSSRNVYVGKSFREYSTD